MSWSCASSLASISLSDATSLGVNKVSVLFFLSGMLSSFDRVLTCPKRRGIMMPLSTFRPIMLDVSSLMTNTTSTAPSSDSLTSLAGL